MRLAISQLAVCIVLIGAPAFLVAQTNPKNEPVAAVVNGQAIPRKSIDRALKGVRPDDMERARAEIIDFLIDNTLIDQYLLQQKVAVDDKELEGRLVEIKKEIEKSKKTLEQVLKDLDMSEAEFRAQVVADQRWEKFALAQSTDANLKAMFERNPEVFDGSMVEPFANAAFALKPYEMSQPVQTQFGMHLILVTARKPGQEVKFEQVKDEVREVYCNKLRDNLVAQLRKAATIQISK